MRIYIVITGYNCNEWLPRCLESVLNQREPDLNVTVVDDASTDPEQLETIKSACRMKTSGHWSYVANKTNMKCPYNIKVALDHLYPYAEPEDVIFLLDGDDFLPHRDVMTRVRSIFTDPDVWLSYGQYDVHPVNNGQVPAAAYPPDVIRDRSYRAFHRQNFNHPLIFRYGVWKGIADADLQDSEGKWFTGGYDKVLMLPMLEMVGDHARFTDEILYTYNSVNPTSECHVRLPENLHSDVVWRRPKKALLQGW